MENKTPFRAVLRPRRRLSLKCTNDCAGGGPRCMVTPGPYYYYLWEANRFPYQSITRATTPRVARVGFAI